jgi:nitrite reductase (NO-forming)
MDKPQTTTDKKTENRRILLIVACLLLIGTFSFGLILLNAKHSVKSAPDMAMDTPVTPSPLTQEQKQQLSEGTSTQTSSKTFTIVGGNFYFSPNRITVNKGDRVTFVFKNAGGQHNLVFPDFKTGTPTILTGQTANMTLLATSPGSFRFICTIAGHVQAGMWGILTVK